MPSILFAAGGSGGHVSPALAVMESLQRRNPPVSTSLVTTEKGVDRQLSSGGLGKVLTISAVSPREILRKPFRTVRANWGAWTGARRILRDEAPDVVVGCGGYASFPVLLAARARRIPIVLLEQNAVPGRVTRIAARWSRIVCCTFGESESYFSGTDVRLTGNPVRRSIAELPPSVDPRPTNGRPVLLVLGGSQGSHAVNNGMLAVADHNPGLLREWDIVHQTGETDRERVAEAYRKVGWKAEVEAFFSDLAPHYARATLAVTRAGATTLAELACVGIPAILIPYPHAADDHQRANARVFERAGAGFLVDQADGHFLEQFEATLHRALSFTNRLDRMGEAMLGLARPQAADAVAEAILSLVTQPK
ncbi:undecaprenyldiphospho-muramoylpentapeptide beta-N-acetylglucosaminyltransferase [Planctomyces sp. SH-PL14]|uniref:undecaprenyldiphospho-muramoylpentapeptide beta-N-acetylglucosaminyltransferase n=1 Tax=Planctomyces sp. SH-PL14 TaxID=1632864 RepID=UPI00094681F8|nr:undecaprenyldiphospho-muramoylpentapeptide beta-N-acetylglucosaminyltransferase [Planctomyces sp. SH-PL14]